MNSKPLRVRGDFAVDQAEAQELSDIYTRARNAYAQLSDSPGTAVQKHAIKFELTKELAAFIDSHPNSGWNPDISVQLGQACYLRGSYSRALDYYTRAWNDTKDSQEAVARQLASESAAALTQLLALTGRADQFDNLMAEIRDTGAIITGYPFQWGKEIMAYARKYPAESFKCGQHCLDNLARLSAPGQAPPRQIVEQKSSTNGWTAAELVQLAKNLNLQFEAAVVTNLANLPIPCVLHLASEHFVVVQQKLGDFYIVFDPLAGRRTRSLEELADEATGCVIVRQDQINQDVRLLDSNASQLFRGRCHNPDPPDEFDIGLCFLGDLSACPPGTNEECLSCGCGMPTYSISENYLNLWIYDTPLAYKPAYGPSLDLKISHNMRRAASSVSGQFNQGARVGSGWTASWLSWAELDVSEYTAEIMLPGAGWALFDLSGGSTSAVNFKENLWVEKLMSGGTTTGIRLHYLDGSTSDYTRKVTDDIYYVFFITSRADPMGNAVTYSYDANNYLTGITSADGVAFTLNYGFTYPEVITSVTNSTLHLGVRFDHAETNLTSYPAYTPIALTSITDASGIKSSIYFSLDFPSELRTPAGTNLFTQEDFVRFDRSFRITHPDGSQELYALLNDYAAGGGTNWPDFGSSQIPTNTPLATLDSTAGERQTRNTFYWNAQQFDPIKTNDVTTFDWPEIKRARIRHWLAEWIDVYTHYSALSYEQAPSSDGTTESQDIVWYDYDGKINNFERGTQIMPAVTARVMPDGSTWYKYEQRNLYGIVTNSIEKWCDGSTTYYRTNRYVLDSNGIDVLGHINVNGKTNAYAYNAYHQKTQFTNVLGEVTSYTYDGTHRLITTAYPSGLLSSNTYGGDGYLSKTVEWAGSAVLRTNTYTWANGNLRVHTNPLGLIITNTWDNLNRLTKTEYPDGSYTQNIYTNGSTDIIELGASRDRLGNWTYYGYDWLRRISKVVDPAGIETHYDYCLCGSPETISKWSGTNLLETTSHTFDKRGRVTQTTAPGSVVTSFAYDDIGRRTVITDALGSSTNLYDNLGRLIEVNKAFGAALINVYDNEDHLTATADANGVITSMTYDDLGRLRTRDFYTGGTEAFGYSASVAAATSYTNQLGNVVQYAYHAAGWKTNEIYVGMATNKFTYDQAGDLRELRDGKDQLTSWGYDEYGRVKSKTNHSNVEILRYSYDANSRLTNRWSKAKSDTKYAYDTVGNLTNINYFSSTDIRYKYDALNRLTNMVDGAGTNTLTYDATGQLATEGGLWASDTITNTYNSAGLRASLAIKQPTSYFNSAYTYDPAHRLTNVTSGAGTFSYYYDPGRNSLTTPSKLITRISLPNTSFITNVWDDLGRLTGTYLKQSGGTITNSHAYLYNNANQRTKHTRTDGSYQTYYYDSVGQLYAARTTNSSGTEITSEKFGYNEDPAWNIKQRTNNITVTTYTLNSLNQITNDGSNTFTFDDNGNRLTQGSVTFSYDDENQLTSTSLAGTYRTDFLYDGKNRLRKRVDYTWNGVALVPTSETRYIYDGMLVVQERTSANTPSVTYTRGTDLSGTIQGAGGIGGLLSRSSGYSSGSWTTHDHYHADGNGNITFLINSSQTIAASYKYNSFGGTVSSSGGTASANIYRFSSKEIHSSSGMYYYGYRFYDPNLQRWLSRDPIDENGFELITRGPRQKEFAPNLYAFVGNNPISELDLYGLLKWKGCQTLDKEEILLEMAFKCALAKARNCFDCLSRGGKIAMNKFCDFSSSGLADVTIVCEDASSGECFKKQRCGYSYTSSRVVHLCRPKPTDCPDVGCTLLHEVAHAAGGVGIDNDPYDPGFDNRAYGISKCLGCTTPKGVF